MARCPHCKRSVPWHKAVIYNKKAGIKCDFCKLALSVNEKDEKLFLYLSTLVAFLFGLILSVVFKNYILSIAVSAASGILFFFTFGWSKIRLEVKRWKRR